MARTAAHVTTVTPNTAIANPAGTAIDATNSHSITPPSAVEKLVLRITNTTASTKVATIKAGANPPAFEAGQGDLSVSLTDGSTTPQTAYVVLGSGRFVQADGKIYVDIASGMTGTIEALYIPRTA